MKTKEELRNMLNPTTFEQMMAVENCVGFFRVGSYLYGTEIQGKSDVDYEAIFLEEPEYVIGTKRVEEVSFSTNKSNTKNTSEDKDIKFYTLRNFFSLAAKGNPNKVEWFFVPEKHVLYKTPLWDKIVENKDIFFSLKVKHSFSGYAASQKHKLITKKKRLEELREFKKVLEDGIAKGAKVIGELDLVETVTEKKYDRTQDKLFVDKKKVLKWRYENIRYYTTNEGADAIQVDDKIYNYGMDVQKIYENVCKEVNAYGQRTKDLDEKGADMKFASHLFRLYYEGLQLLKEGRIDFPIHENKFLIEVKEGRYDIDFLMSKAESFEPLFEVAYLNSKLPHAPNYKEIGNLQYKLYLEYWRSKGLI